MYDFKVREDWNLREWPNRTSRGTGTESITYRVPRTRPAYLGNSYAEKISRMPSNRIFIRRLDAGDHATNN